MRTTVLAALVAISGLSIVGCKSDDDGMMHDKSTTMSMDACPRCPGVQTATADGKCPACGMNVADMKKTPSPAM